MKVAFSVGIGWQKKNAFSYTLVSLLFLHELKLSLGETSKKQNRLCLVETFSPVINLGSLVYTLVDSVVFLLCFVAVSLLVFCGPVGCPQIGHM